MTTTGNTFRQFLALRHCFAFGLLLLLSSCAEKNVCIATYTIQDKNADLDTKNTCIRFMNNIANKYDLTIEKPNYPTYTLSSKGEPYSGLTYYWLENKDTSSIFKVWFWKVYDNQINYPYRDVVNDITDSVQTNFTSVDHKIVVKDTSDKKAKWVTLDK